MNDRTQQLENGNIRKLLFTFALPSIIATTATSLYNVIDRIFIGNDGGALALAGLGITLPVMNLATALGTLVGAGSSALVSIRIGEKKREEATRILCNAFLLNVIISLCFTATALFFLKPILLLFGADEQTLPYATQFLEIILWGNIFTHLLFGLNSIMRSSGYPFKAMLSVLITVVCNVILAPILIFGCKWGIRGAATATVISQFTGLCWVMAHFIHKKSYIHFERKAMRIYWPHTRDVFAIGLSPFFIHVCASLVTIIMNWRLKDYGGNMAIASYGIIAAIQSLVITMVLGMTHGMQPIVGYNYGAKNYSRALQTYWLTVRWATIICAISFAALQLFPQYISRAFTDESSVIRDTAHAMRICCSMMFIIGFQVVTSNFFQSINKAFISVVLSLLRQLLFLIPFIWFLPLMFNLNGAWWATPCADICSVIVTGIILWRFLRDSKWKNHFSQT